MNCKQSTIFPSYQTNSTKINLPKLLISNKVPGKILSIFDFMSQDQRGISADVNNYFGMFTTHLIFSLILLFIHFWTDQIFGKAVCFCEQNSNWNSDFNYWRIPLPPALPYKILTFFPIRQLLRSEFCWCSRWQCSSWII